MESPSNGDVEGMKSPGLDIDKGSHGLIHRQDYLSILNFLPLLISPAVRESLKYEWDWGSYSQICTVRELEWPVFNFAILENFDFTANNFYQLDYSTKIPLTRKNQTAEKRMRKQCIYRKQQQVEHRDFVSEVQFILNICSF